MILKFAVVEDEETCAKTLLEMIERYRKEKTLTDEYKISVFKNAREFFSDKSDYDAVFLDIQMEGMNGMEIAQEIRKNDDNVLIIFVTNMAQYAVESYDVHAYDFIMKPLEYAVFSMKYDRIYKKLAHNMRDVEITLTYGAIKKKAFVSDITYVEVVNHNLTVHLKNGEFRMRGTITDMEKKLAKYHFVRCNSCYLVNLKYVSFLQGDFVTVDGKELRISHLKKPAFLAEVAKYMGNSI